MSSPRKIPPRVLAMALSVLWGTPCAYGASAAPSPDVSLYDAPAAVAEPLTEAAFAARDGWSQVAEDDTTRKFQGCAVLANDKVAAVLSPDAPDIAVYSRQIPGLKLCARLQPLCAGRADFRRTALTIRENTPSSVAMPVPVTTAAALPAATIVPM